MQTVTVTPKFVNPPKPGGKFGNIKVSDSEIYFAPPHLISRVQPGQPVTIAWKQEQWTKGPVMIVTEIHGSAPAAGNEPPPPTPESYGGQAPAPAHRASNGDTKSGDMFVMGVVGRAMGSGQFSAHDVKALTLAAEDAWQALQAKRAGQSPFQ